MSQLASHICHLYVTCCYVTVCLNFGRQGEQEVHLAKTAVMGRHCVAEYIVMYEGLYGVEDGKDLVVLLRQRDTMIQY